jgi:hypothetical protein
VVVTSVEKSRDVERASVRLVISPALALVTFQLRTLAIDVELSIERQWSIRNRFLRIRRNSRGFSRGVVFAEDDI